MPVEAGVGDQLWEAAFGLVDEAGGQGDGGWVIAQPGAAPLGEPDEGVVDQVVGVVAVVRTGAGGVAWLSPVGGHSVLSDPRQGVIQGVPDRANRGPEPGQQQCPGGVLGSARHRPADVAQTTWDIYASLRRQSPDTPA
jgi:hypothetical protein